MKRKPSSFLYDQTATAWLFSPTTTAAGAQVRSFADGGTFRCRLSPYNQTESQFYEHEGNVESGKMMYDPDSVTLTPQDEFSIGSKRYKIRGDITPGNAGQYRVVEWDRIT